MAPPTRSRWIAAMWALSSLTFGSTELKAQDTRLEARERFDRGLTLVDQGDVEGALAEFQRAYALVPHPRVLYNIGLVHAAAGRMVEAYDALDAVLKEAKGLGAAQLEHARAMREQSLARIGYIRVEVDAASAEVEIAGGSPQPASRPLRVTSGRHHLTVRAPGRESRRLSVSVAGGETRAVTLQLVPSAKQPASLTVSCALIGAVIRVDGEVVGETPLPAPLTISSGDHVIEVVREGYVPVRRKITLGPGVSGEVDANLRVDGALLGRVGGRLDLRVREDNVLVWIDDQARQTTSLLLPPGRHRLRVERAGFVSFEREVEVRTGAVVRVDVELVPDAGYRRDYRDAALSQRKWGWIGIGSGAAMSVGAVAFLFWNRSAQQSAQQRFDEEAPRHESSGPCWAGLSERPDDCKDLDTLVDDIDAANSRFGYGWAALGVGAVVAGVGTYLLLSGDDPDRYEPGPESEFLVSVGLEALPVASGFGLSLNVRSW